MMRKKHLQYHAVSGADWFSPEAWAGMDALVKSAFYAATKKDKPRGGSGEEPEGPPKDATTEDHAG